MDPRKHGGAQLGCGIEQELATGASVNKQKVWRASGNQSYNDVLSSMISLINSGSSEEDSTLKKFTSTSSDVGGSVSVGDGNNSLVTSGAVVAAAATTSAPTNFTLLFSTSMPSQFVSNLDSENSEIIQSGVQYSAEEIIAKLKSEAAENPYKLEALDEKWQSFLIALYSFTALTSFILNAITVIVLLRCRRSELREYLINLSLSDLLMSLLSIPFTYTEYMLGRWVFSAFLCPLVRFVVTLSVFVSAATMTVIGVNRHLAIVDPFGKSPLARVRNLPVSKNYVIVSIWLIGIVISLPEFLMFSVQSFCYNNKIYYDCRQLWPNSIENTYAVFIYLCTFAIPLSLLSYLYGCIMIKLWRRRVPGEADVSRDLAIQQMRIKTIKMLCVVVIMFAISWLPMQTFSMVVYLNPTLRQGVVYESFQYNLFIGAYFACHWLSMAHSCLNPLIYCFMNDKFLNDLRDLVFRNSGSNGSTKASRHQVVTSTNALRLISNNQNLNHDHHHHPQQQQQQQQQQHSIITLNMKSSGTKETAIAVSKVTAIESITIVNGNGCSTTTTATTTPAHKAQLWIRAMQPRVARRRSQSAATGDQDWNAPTAEQLDCLMCSHRNSSPGDRLIGTTAQAATAASPTGCGFARATVAADNQSAASSRSASVSACCLRAHYSSRAPDAAARRSAPGEIRTTAAHKCSATAAASVAAENHPCSSISSLANIEMDVRYIGDAAEFEFELEQRAEPTTSDNI